LICGVIILTEVILVPESDMSAITAMLEEGLNKMKESMVDFLKQICPSLDCFDLAEANIFLPIRWRHAVKGILSAFFF
jgi:hypothetical protein